MDVCPQSVKNHCFRENLDPSIRNTYTTLPYRRPVVDELPSGCITLCVFLDSLLNSIDFGICPLNKLSLHHCSFIVNPELRSCKNSNCVLF